MGRNNDAVRRRLVSQRARRSNVRLPQAGRNAQERRRSSASEWLTTWGTFISAVAAAGGLVVSGIASWTAVATLQDQREESAESEAAAQSHQASRVSVWLDYDHRHFLPSHGEQTAYILNRSPDPINSWEIMIDFPPKSGSGLPSTPPGLSSGMFVEPRQTIPPCTLVKFDASDISTDDFASSQTSEGPAAVTGIEFSDSYGRRWRRGISSPLRKGPFPGQGRTSLIAENHHKFLRAKACSS